MQRENLVTIIAGFTILGAAAAITAWPEPTHEPNTAETDRGIVRVEAVTAGSSTDTLHLAGVTRSARHAELSFSLPARLAGRPVEIGDRVSTGQILASLDDREFRLAARAAEAAALELEVRLAQAERDRDRVRQLVDARAATREELEQMTAATSALEAALGAARARVDETSRLVAESVLRAPFAGSVTAVMHEPGEWVNPGETIVEIAGDGVIEIVIEAPESVWDRMAVGQPVHVDLPFVDRVVTGRITKIAGAAAGPGRLFPVEISMDAADGLVAGLTADVSIELAARPELTIPLRAVVNPGSSIPKVYRIADGMADEIPVELGRVRGDRIAVIADLAADEMVAVAGHTGLRDGDLVEVRR